MQSKPLSKLPIIVMVSVGAVVVVWALFQAVDEVPFPARTAATSTPAVASAASSTALIASSQPSLPSTTIRAPQGAISAAVASTDAERELGLTGSAPLSKDSGMLFVFQNAGGYGFWMKGMRFPIDMIWIGADKRVSGVVPGASPDSYPAVFYPPAPIEYVLELDSGGAASHGIATGTQLVF